MTFKGLDMQLGLIYTIEEKELTIAKVWEYSRRLREGDKVRVKRSKGIITILEKEDLCGIIRNMSLPEKTHFYNKLKRVMNYYSAKGLKQKAEFMQEEVRIFKEKYLSAEKQTKS
ncbi:MAG: hypothetical protein QW404_01975 [Candidatus Nanoarchaeia archaeon]